MDNPQYYAVMTKAGAELEAKALETGKGIILTHIAVGDANRQEVTPDVNAKSLVHEVYRKAIDGRAVDENDPAITLLKATIPIDAGGWWIYELGVVGHLEGETDEVLYAYANHAPYYKMLPQTGQSVSHELCIPIVQRTDARLSLELPQGDYVTRESFISPQRDIWKPSDDIMENTVIDLPEGMHYWVDQSRLEFFWCGLKLAKGTHYEEVGAHGVYSTSIKLLFTAYAGSELQLEIYS